jgi:hypothetical protein
MAALIKRVKITKIRVTDDSGVEHEFEGEGTIRLEGLGPDLVLSVHSSLELK